MGTCRQWGWAGGCGALQTHHHNKENNSEHILLVRGREEGMSVTFSL